VCIRLSRCALVDLVVTGQRCAPAAAAAASGEGASLGGRTRAHYPVETVMTEWCGGGWGICQLRSCSTAAAARVIRKLSRERRSGRPESCVRSIAVGFSASARIMSRHCCVRRSVHLCTLGVMCAPVRRLGVTCWAQTGRVEFPTPLILCSRACRRGVSVASRTSSCLTRALISSLRHLSASSHADWCARNAIYCRPPYLYLCARSAPLLIV